jgi:hypothetical protein
LIVVEIRDNDELLTSPSFWIFLTATGFERVWTDPLGASGMLISTNVFQFWHSGHRPSHLEDSLPQLLQTKIFFEAIN